MDDARFQELRQREFSRLDALGHVYLDYTGAGLYSEAQVRANAEMLCGSVLGNPHSRNPTSLAATNLCEDARRRVLDYFNADPALYEVVFTLNASGALKLIGEAYPWEPGGRFLLTADNHNSVNGLREFAQAHGAEVRYVPPGPELRLPALEEHLAGADRARHNLFAFPAQSNFSGVKYPLDAIGVAHEHGYHVVLDAAAFVPTNRLDLRGCAPDFVCVSFYKMFGFPTGVGVLLARRNALGELHRPWFAGGTVRFVSAQNKVHLQHVTGRAFEDGTLNYLGIAAVPAGLDFLDEIGIERINAHVMRLTEALLADMLALRHGNGAPMVRIYGPKTMETRGGTVAFNLLDPRGGLVDFRMVEQRASDAGISLRTGFFCNPGAAEFAFEYPDEDAFRCIKQLTPETFNIQVFSDCMSDHPVGAVRVSVGIASNRADLARLMEVLCSFRDGGCEAPAGTELPALATVD
ncbi:MAG: aminotransferase class V-fold PLP-dependent enzyme [Gemmatimonadetes bacterium]|nr:aminotransferase class V-fold PLP-dependent enzyme [Gemmatimonadota bacterium]